MDRRFYLHNKRDYKIFESYLNEKLKDGLVLSSTIGSIVNFERIDSVKHGKYKIWIKYWKTDDRVGTKAKKTEITKAVEGTEWKLLFENNKFYYFFTEDLENEFPIQMSEEEEKENENQRIVFTKPRIHWIMLFGSTYIFVFFTAYLLHSFLENLFFDDTILLKWLMGIVSIVAIELYWIKYSNINLKKYDISHYYTDFRGTMKRLGFLIVYGLILTGLIVLQPVIKEYRESNRIEYLNKANLMDVSIESKIADLQFVNSEINLDDKIFGRTIFPENIEVKSEMDFTQKLAKYDPDDDRITDTAFWEEQLKIEHSFFVPERISYYKKEDGGLYIGSDTYKCMNNVIANIWYNNQLEYVKRYIENSDWNEYGGYEYKEDIIKKLEFDVDEQYIITRMGGVCVLVRDGNVVYKLEVIDKFGHIDAEKLAYELKREMNDIKLYNLNGVDT